MVVVVVFVRQIIINFYLIVVALILHLKCTVTEWDRESEWEREIERERGSDRKWGVTRESVAKLVHFNL